MLNGTDAPSERSGPLAKSKKGPGLLGAAVDKSVAIVSFLSLPYRLLLEWWAGFTLRALAVLGVQPQGYVAQAQMRELTAVVQHMHLREDAYRKHIAELQEELDARDSDRRKALRKLKKTKLELDLLSEQVADLQLQQQDSPYASPGEAYGGGAAAGPTNSGTGGGSGGREARAGLHASMALLLASVFWFYQSDQPAIQRKLLFAVLFPLCWVYVLTLASPRPPYPIALLLCTSWAIIGFVSAHKLTPNSYD